MYLGIYKPKYFIQKLNALKPLPPLDIGVFVDCAKTLYLHGKAIATPIHTFEKVITCILGKT